MEPQIRQDILPMVWPMIHMVKNSTISYIVLKIYRIYDKDNHISYVLYLFLDTGSSFSLEAVPSLFQVSFINLDSISNVRLLHLVLIIWLVIYTVQSIFKPLIKFRSKWVNMHPHRTIRHNCTSMLYDYNIEIKTTSFVSRFMCHLLKMLIQ